MSAAPAAIHESQGEPMADATPRADLNPPHQHVDGRSLTDEEQRNVAAMARFRDLYNGEDMERFVGDAYAPSFHVLNLDGSSWTAGRANRQNLLSDSPRSSAPKCSSRPKHRRGAWCTGG